MRRTFIPFLITLLLMEFSVVDFCNAQKKEQLPTASPTEAFLATVALAKVVAKAGPEYSSNTVFHVLVLAERGGIHEGFVVAALDWLKNFSAEQHFQYDIINNTDSISESFLSHYQEFLQLNYPPYMWTDRAKAAFIKYMEEGRGGWVGLHHASLLGEFDGYAMWDWFSEFMGGIRWKNYIAARATATVRVEDKNHPVMKGLPESFSIPDDEWYTYNKDPRPRVHVIANVDESSYQPPSDIKMGDHPVIWSNDQIKARNIYFQMGHHANLFHSPEFIKMLSNAILWAAVR